MPDVGSYDDEFVIAAVAVEVLDAWSAEDDVITVAAS